MWVSVLIASALLIGLTSLGAAVAKAKRRRRRYADVCGRWRLTSAHKRTQVFRSLTDGTDVNAPAWYLLGSAYLREHKTREAARAFGIAHHADCNLETAALLTFACLKAREGEATDIIEQALDTWQELNRPPIARRWEDRLMLDCLQSTTRDPPALSPLGCLLWLVVGPAQQSRMEQLLADHHPRWAALLRDSK